MASNSSGLVTMSQIEQKIVMLKILIQFSKFCVNEGLSYFLDAGTLIGAIRHKGYIPWDDDIDVNMPRQDYDQFCKLLKNKNYLLTPDLVVEMPFNTIYPYIKISDKRTVLIEFPNKNPIECKVYIDVFPKDAIRNKKLYSKIICKISELLHLFQWFNKYSIYAWKCDKNILKRYTAWLGSNLIINPNTPIILQNKLIAWYNNKNKFKICKYVTTLVNGEFNKCAPIECFSGYIMKEFEGEMFRVPVDYDTYLRCLYKGDYMIMPPEENRVKHDTIVYWKTEEARLEVMESNRVEG